MNTDTGKQTASTAVRCNSLKAWVLASRPKTLAGAAAPVIVGTALSWATLVSISGNIFSSSWIIPSSICLVFALLMQIDANFINDYFDFKKGSDTSERLGPERACAQGWITPAAMKTGITVTTILAFLCGLPLIFYGGWAMLIVGILCVLGAFLYTTRLSYQGLGDLMVILYFGIVPVFFTWFTSTASVPDKGPLASYLLCGALAVVAGFAMGFVTDNLLIVNNYRDVEEDRKNGKNTLVVRLGKKAAEWLYLINGCVAVAGALLIGGWMKKYYSGTGPQIESFFPFHLLIPLLFLPFLYSAHRKMVQINRGRGLNAILGKTSKNILIFSLLLTTSIVVLTLQFWFNG